MFRNAAGQHFQDVTTSGGFGHLQKGHGIAFGDIDNDGDQDVFANMGGAFTGDTYRNALFQNPGHNGQWITLQLEGVQSNRSAIGACIQVVVKTAHGERAIYRTVGSGGSFGCSPLRQEIGLGQAQSIDRVEVFWPATGKTQIFRSLPMRHAYRIRENAAEPIAWALQPIVLRTGEGQHHEHRHHEHAPSEK